MDDTNTGMEGGHDPDRAEPAGMNIVAATGGFQMDRQLGWRVGPLLDHALTLSGSVEPRLCFLSTATGDDLQRTAMMYAAFNRERPAVRVSHLALFPMPNVTDMRRHLLAQDVIWVGGGSVVNLLAVWRAHGLDEIFREAWQVGVILGGTSAGSLCWHAGGTTDSFGLDLRPVTNGLGLLPFSNTPHYDSEEQRRPLFQRLVADGTLPAGWATDEGVALHFRGTELAEAVSDREGAFAWQVQRSEDGEPVETRVEPRVLSPAE